MRIIQYLPNKRTQELIDYINTYLLPLATEEQAKCAKDRLQLWLNAEPIYRTGKYRDAHTDERLWQFCQRVFPQAALAQIYFAKNQKAIDWHKDAAYAQPTARIINLGKICLQTRLPDNKIRSLELNGGEIIEFNSKLPHRAIHRCDQRIGIGLWTDQISIHNPQNWE
ncbi:hypothetical protein ACQ4M3_13450 [Leptolyngbya sp. AN03gr2]|uniref:hypothetical protein n=1 Tax=unclassified Leptolyngbya TaxID=2650499 RepID=UPI003D310551